MGVHKGMTKLLVYAGISAFTGLLLSNRMTTSGQDAAANAAAVQDPGVQSGNRGAVRPSLIRLMTQTASPLFSKTGSIAFRKSRRCPDPLTSAWGRGLMPISAVRATPNQQLAVQARPPIHNSSSSTTGPHRKARCPLSLPPMARSVKSGSRST